MERAGGFACDVQASFRLQQPCRTIRRHHPVGLHTGTYAMINQRWYDEDTFLSRGSPVVHVGSSIIVLVEATP